MNKKNLIQLMLVVSLIVIVYIFYIYFFVSKPIPKEEVKIENLEIETNDQTNVIENLKFSSFDKSGNKYLIEALYGSADLVDDIVYYDMTNVVAVIKFPNGEKIEIKSNYARYNSLTYETNFKENIIARYINHTLTSENLDLLFLDNLITVYNKLIYKNLNDTLIADKLEIDIITKNLKIFMNNEYESVKIIRN